MAKLDVSFLMNDPDFVDPVSIVRRTTTINDYGENQLGETTITAIASVQAADGETLASLPEAARLTDVRNIFTKTELIQDENGKYSDVIIWQGKRYILMHVRPWDNFGAGWFKGVMQYEGASV